VNTRASSQGIRPSRFRKTGTLKKLDLLILRAFTGPFVVTFFIALFVLMMQTLWKYIDDLVGKDLDMVTILSFVWYASASLLVLAMPIAILISSIMTFGNMGERFELVAIKSSGISLLRFMRPLIIFSIFLCGVSFVFANYVIPFANLKFKTIYFDIMYKKPALDLKEGTFFSVIPGYSIKVSAKDKDQQRIYGVVVYEQQGVLQDNCIVAEKGRMQLSPDKRFLEFRLQNGYRYQERGNLGDTATEFIRMRFSDYKKVFDVSSLKMNKTSDTLFRNDSRMLNIVQLERNIDSLTKMADSAERRFRQEVNRQLHYAKLPDSIWKLARQKSPARPDSSFLASIPDSLRLIVLDGAINTAASIRNIYQFTAAELAVKRLDTRFSRIEWHRKFSLSLSCLVLFFIGAPLGSIIRKGGLGMPLVIALIFFIIFHLLNIFGEKFAKEEVTSLVFGMWMPILVLVPVGAFLTYKAMHDSQLFNREFYYRLLSQIRSRIHAGRRKHAADYQDQQKTSND
jgi:lipopolysaccharide export system permease protein